MKEDLLRQLPSISELLATPEAHQWLAVHPRKRVSDCLRDAVDQIRQAILADSAGHCGAAHTKVEYVIAQAARLLAERTELHLRPAINATGIILHTGLGRAVLDEDVAASMGADLAGYVTLAIDRESGQRSDRDRRVEYLLTELTGAEAATVVNNNAAATLLVLAALAADRQTLVSRGQLIEIGGAFRLPDVMAASRTIMVEVGTTNRTHLRDYEQAVTDATAAILRVHPSNYRIVGFASQPELAELAELAHARNVLLIDDLGAGALVGLEQFGLPHEPTVGESIAAGADVVLFSGDKLIGASQSGILVGKKQYIDRIRKHPLARTLRIDKGCLMGLERTLRLFRDPATLPQRHPLYRMLTTPIKTLQARAEALKAALAAELANRGEGVSPAVHDLVIEIVPGSGYLGSGSLPMHELPTVLVRLSHPNIKPEELARRLRLDPAAVFTRIENDRVLLDMRTVKADQIPEIGAAVERILRP